MFDILRYRGHNSIDTNIVQLYVNTNKIGLCQYMRVNFVFFPGVKYEFCISWMHARKPISIMFKSKH